MPASIFPKQSFPASPTELPSLSLSREGEGTHAFALAPVELEVLPMAFKENLCNFLAHWRSEGQRHDGMWFTH